IAPTCCVSQLSLLLLLSLIPSPPTSTLFPYTTLFRSPQKFPVAGVVSLKPLGRYGERLKAAGISVQTLGLKGLPGPGDVAGTGRSEEHTSELQSHLNLVCRLLLEKKKKIRNIIYTDCK